MKKSLAWAGAILWMAVIIMLSNQPATDSNRLSKGITELIVEIVEKVAPGMELDVRELNHKMRKNAHYFAYLLLGVLVARAIGISGFKPAIALCMCFLFAVADETYQTFIPGRGGQVTDVLIDTAGAATGILLFSVKERLYGKRNN